MNQDRTLAKAHLETVLILEDEALVAMLMEDVVRELGASRVDVFSDTESALEAATSGSYDCAILDLLLHGKPSTPIADVLQARGIPFIFSTGSTQDSLEPRHRHYPLLGKPFADADLKSQLLCAVTRSDMAPGTGT